MASESRTAGHPRIDLPLDQIGEICRRYRVSRLALFGSVLRDDFRPDSDVDLLVEFLPDTRTGLKFFALQDELSVAIGRTVDLNTPGCFGPLLRPEVLTSALPIYVAA